MKKGLLILLALAMLGTFAFADMSASVYMTGSLYGTNGFVVNNQNQKDADMLQFSISGETTGASFRLWANLDGDASTVHMRSAMLWWKPITMLKLSIGFVGGYGYTEQLDWWKVPMGASIEQRAYWENRYSSASTGENVGIQVDLNPIPDLTITAGVYPGPGVATGGMPTGDEDFYDANMAYGFQAKYNIAGIGSVLGAYKDAGMGHFKQARVGMDLNAVPNLYAFVSGIFYWDDHSTKSSGWTPGMDAADGNGMKIRGIAIDNYIKYSMDKISIQVKVPFTVRLNEDEITGDESYLLWSLKVSYSMDGGITPYLRVEENDDNALDFNDVENTLGIMIKPGLNWNVDKGNFDLALQINVPPASGDITWAIPFEARINF